VKRGPLNIILKRGGRLKFGKSKVRGYCQCGRHALWIVCAPGTPIVQNRKKDSFILLPLFGVYIRKQINKRSAYASYMIFNCYHILLWTIFSSSKFLFLFLVTGASKVMGGQAATGTS